MGGKRQLILATLLILLGSSGLLGYSYMEQQTKLNFFPESGYILIDNPEAETKQLLFTGGTTWRDGLDETVSFDDVQGKKTEVSSKSFVHYETENLSALSDGVVVDLNDISSARMTNHYAVSSKVVFASAGPQGYTPSNSSSELQLTDFLWKLDDNKFMLVSKEMQIHFSEEDVREAGDYIEVTYVDGEVIQIQTQENLWQTVSKECWVLLDNSQVVDLSYRNVRATDGSGSFSYTQDEDGRNTLSGDVLLDFGKLSLHSDDYIDLAKLTVDLIDAVSEDVVPHFDITATPGEDGQNGAQGSNGSNGSIGVSGETGEIGEDGESGAAGTGGNPGEAGSAGSDGAAGSNGSAGSSGTNGAGGDPGASKPKANPGDDAEVDIVQFPVFSLAATETNTTAWNISATGCAGTIVVEDQDGMLTGDDPERGLYNSIYLIDVVSGAKINTVSANDLDFQSQNAEGYPFSFSGLEPDHAYRLIVEAPYNPDRATSGSTSYVRAFIDKTFWTDSTGVYAEAGSSTIQNVSFSLTRRDYAPDGMQVYYRVFNSYSDASKVENAITDDWTDTTVTNGNTGTFSILANHNEKKYVRLLTVLPGNAPSLSEQILELQALKQKASVAAPTITSNRDSWGFDLAPGVVSDPDQGIVSYSYEFYEYNTANFTTDTSTGVISLRPNATPVHTVTSTLKNGLIVPMDGVKLQAGRQYCARAIATFYDNEKTYQIASPVSNPAVITGGRRPAVYFVPNNENGTPSGGTSSSAASAYYDVLYGTVHVDPGTDGMRLLLTQNFYAKLTVRASGYYYTQITVYNSAAMPPENERDPKYLQATVRQGGYVEIPLTMRQLTPTGIISQGDVTGLRPDTSYSLIVSGHLTNDGVNATEYDSNIGICTVGTPDTTTLATTWTKASDTNTSGSLGTVAFSAKVAGANESQQAQLKSVFNQQLTTLSHMKITLYSGMSSSGTTPTQVGTPIELDRANTSADTIRALSMDESAEKLEDLMKAGINLDIKSFGFRNNNGENDVTAFNALNLPAVHLAIEEVYDYTYYTSNRVNQKAYTTLPDDSTAPPEMPLDGAVYITEFTLDNPYLDIVLTGVPDPIPDSEKGFLLKEDGTLDHGVDTNRDQLFDEFVVTPRYPNGAKLVTSITYYVFDAPDFYREYTSGGNWVLNSLGEVVKKNWDSASSDSSWSYTVNDLYTPVTVRMQGEGNDDYGPWLGRSSVIINQEDGTIPGLHFCARKAGNEENNGVIKRNEGTDGSTYYWQSKYPQRDADGNIYLYYDDHHKTEPANGHQFVIAWTLSYKLKNETFERIYPFEIRTGEGAYAMDQMRIPHSAPQDVPFLLPTVTAAPMTMKKGVEANQVAKWRLWIYDPDKTVPVDEYGKTCLYRKTSRTSGLDFATEVTAPVSQNPYTGNAYNFLTADYSAASPGGYDVTIKYEISENSWAQEESSVTAALQVQRYTDKYLQAYMDDLSFYGAYDVANRSLFKEYNSGQHQYIANYRNGTDPLYRMRYDYEGGNPFSAQTYFDAFSFNMEKNTTSLAAPAANAAKIDMERPAETDESLHFTVYNVGDWQLINGVELTFTDNSNSNNKVTVYKPIRAAGSSDNYEAPREVEVGSSTVTGIQFDLLISTELNASMQGHSVSISGRLAYEDGTYGYGAVTSPAADDRFALGNYSVNSNAEFFSLNPGAHYILNGNKLGTVAVTDPAPRLGSFFRLQVPSGTNNLVITHPSGTPSDTQPLNFNGIWGTTGGYLASAQTVNRYMPYKLAMSDEKTPTADGGGLATSIVIPTVTKVIQYQEVTANVTSVNVKASVAGGGNANYYFTLQDINGAYVQLPGMQQIKILNPVDGTYKDVYAFECQASDGMISTELLNLAKYTDYTMRAFYKRNNDDDYMTTLKELKNSTLANNDYSFRTWLNPMVELRGNYGNSQTGYYYYRVQNYFNKLIYPYLTIERMTRYYYTLELQDESGTFLTYLAVGNNSTSNTNHNYYINGYGSGSYAIRQNNILTVENGVVQISNAAEPYPLEYGKRYKVVAHVYEPNHGPAYGRGVDDDVTSGGAQGVVGELFTVTDSATTFSINPVVTTSGITFNAIGSLGGATLRGNQLAIKVTAKAPDGTETDISDIAKVGTDFVVNGQESNHNFRWGSGSWPVTVSRLDLRQKLGVTSLQNYEITCTLYGDRDDTSGSAQYHSQRARSELIQDEHAILVLRSVLITGDEASAGTVNISRYNASNIRVELQDPISIETIKTITTTVVANWHDSENSDNKGSSAAPAGNLSAIFTPQAGGRYTMDFPINISLEEGQILDSYDVRVQFLDENRNPVNIAGSGTGAVVDNTAQTIIEVNSQSSPSSARLLSLPNIRTLVPAVVDQILEPEKVEIQEPEVPENIKQEEGEAKTPPDAEAILDELDGEKPQEGAETVVTEPEQPEIGTVDKDGAQDDPAAPAQQDDPAAPAQQDTPATPAQQDTPATPAQQDTPATPAQQDAPATPAQQDAPATPAQQDTPATPAQQDDTPASTQQDDTPAPTQQDDTPASTQQDDTPASTQQDDTPASTQQDDTPASQPDPEPESPDPAGV